MYEMSRYWVGKPGSLYLCAIREIREACVREVSVFLDFTMQICSKSEWGSTSTVLMFMLYWREQMIGNCTSLLQNTRPTHIVNI